MTFNSGKICYLILKEVFDERVASIGDKLHQWNGQTFQQLLLPPRVQKTAESLVVLINHNLVSFQECPRTGRATYNLLEDRVLSLLKFPRYLILGKTLFGDEGELVIEELFKMGQASMTSVLFKSAKRLFLAKKANEDKIEPSADIVKALKIKFNQLVDCQFLCRLPSPYTLENPNPDIAIIPFLQQNQTEIYAVPEINFKEIKEAIDKVDEDPDYEMEIKEGKDDAKILWRLNYERFQREFRDQIIVQTVTRRLDPTAGSLMRLLLNLMNECSPWAPESIHIRANEIFAKVEKHVQEMGDNSQRLQEFFDQYLKILEEDRTRFIDRVGDAGGGEYKINAKHIFTELAAATAESIVLERYGSKALRIFRVVREKLHIEESQLQNLVMIPAKEVKYLTYSLMEGNFIKIQELRKSMAANNAMGKSFFLFYVDLPQVARMVVEHCYLAISNCYKRKNHEAEVNHRLLDKHEHIESISANIKNSEEFETSEELQLQLQEIQDMVCYFFLNHHSI